LPPLFLISKEGDPVQAILVDAYNRTAAPMPADVGDVGDALPLSDQWMLILTLVIWLFIVPGIVPWYRVRRRVHGKPA